MLVAFWLHGSGSDGKFRITYCGATDVFEMTKKLLKWGRNEEYLAKFAKVFCAESIVLL